MRAPAHGAAARRLRYRSTSSLIAKTAGVPIAMITNGLAPAKIGRDV